MRAKVPKPLNLREKIFELHDAVRELQTKQLKDPEPKLVARSDKENDSNAINHNRHRISVVEN